MIRFDRFSWHYAGAPRHALQDVSLGVDRGEFVTIAGASGSGKSTLAQAMCGLLVGRQAGDASGTVCIGGKDVAATPLHEVAQTIGLVQQNPDTHFATLTVRDELAFAMENRCLSREEIRRRSDEAAELLSIGHLKDRALASLSGGEKQRVAVASILAGSPDVLVLDEPTASLDPEASRDLFCALAGLCRQAGLTVLVIEHKLAHLLPLAPRLIVLADGHVTSDNTAGSATAAHARGGFATGAPTLRHAGVATGSTPAREPLAAVTDVSVTIDGNRILAGVSLRIHAGEVIAVMGPNGGGKTTLLHALLGLVPGAQGSARVAAIDVTAASVSRLAEQIGLVFQNADHQLVAEQVWREALFTASSLRCVSATVERDAHKLLDRAGLGDRQGDHPFRLSWGQKRRLNLISAILHEPPLLLLDEPFAGQDWENVTFLLDVIDRIVYGPPDTEETRPHGACMMVTHDPRIVLHRCTRLLFVSGGRVVVDAPVQEGFDQLRRMGHEAYTSVVDD
jgi:energy-coupling factor transport system ATP-binding protein